MSQTIVAIALGGAVGAVLRFVVANGVNQWFGKNLPYGTLTVNVVGSLAIGVLVVVFTERALLDSPLAKGLMVGVLGAFTTFSTFSLDTFTLLAQGELLRAGLNVLLNVMLCLLGVSLGVLVGRAIC